MDAMPRNRTTPERARKQGVRVVKEPVDTLHVRLATRARRLLEEKIAYALNLFEDETGAKVQAVEVERELLVTRPPGRPLFVVRVRALV